MIALAIFVAVLEDAKCRFKSGEIDTDRYRRTLLRQGFTATAAEKEIRRCGTELASDHKMR